MCYKGVTKGVTLLITALRYITYRGDSLKPTVLSGLDQLLACGGVSKVLKGVLKNIRCVCVSGSAACL
jgi:hypothetical protein